MIYEPFIIQNPLEIRSLYTLFKLYCASGYTFTGEIHNFWECVYVIDGEICVSSDENIYILNSGDIVFHKPQEFHKFHVDKDKEATLLIFSFNLEGNLLNKIVNTVCTLDVNQRNIMNNFINFFDTECEKNPATKEHKYRYNVFPYFKDDEIYMQSVRLFILQLIVSISNRNVSLNSVQNSETKLLKSAIETMENKIETNLTISDLAKSLNISLSTLKRVFKKYTGMSVYKYYLTIKTRTATNMLQNGMNVSEVALKLGFSSPAYFSATYKREAGCSPSKHMPNR